MIIEEVKRPTVVIPSTVKELIAEYKSKGTYKNLSQSSQKSYDYYLYNIINSPYANTPIGEFTPVLCNLIYDSIKKNNSLVTANFFVSVMRLVYSFAQSQDWIVVNPWTFINRSIPQPRDTVWTKDQVESFIAFAIKEGKLHIAKGVALMYDTAQRPGDVLKLTFENVKKDKYGWYIEFNQQKTGTKVSPSVSDTTADLVGFGNCTDLQSRLIGGNYSLAAFRTGFKLLCKAMEFPKRLQLRDLRRTGITEAGEASDDQMKAMSGHKTRAMLDTYSVRNRSKAHAAFTARGLNEPEGST